MQRKVCCYKRNEKWVEKAKKRAPGWNGSGDTLKILTPKVNVLTNTGVSAVLSGSRKTKLQQDQRLLTVINTARINQPQAGQHTSELT